MAGNSSKGKPYVPPHAVENFFLQSLRNDVPVPCSKDFNAEDALPKFVEESNADTVAEFAAGNAEGPSDDGTKESYQSNSWVMASGKRWR